MTFAMETPTSCTTTVLADLDPDSLRAKALSTLRAKRKRPAAQLPIISLPSRPIHQADAMQLDYGQDDSSPPSVQQSQEKPAAVVTQEPTAKPDVDVSMREEGEISDEEEEPAPKPPHRTTAAIAAQDSFKYSIGSKPSLLDRLTDPQPQPPPPHMVHGLPRKPVTSALPPRPPPTQPRSALQISEEQVRPNLHMTQAEYDKAKDIILDLLGWGVPPHYLVDCGLTREMVFYVFNELNLRLPSNLDTTGLMPYSPETIHTFSVVPPGPSRPPVPASPAQPSPVSRKPEGPSPIESVATLSLPATPTPAQQKHLDEVESLKKQELMARKQALASRRRRPVAQPAEKLVPIENTPDASVTAAEDFLKSITPTGRVPPSPMDLVADSRVPSSPSEQTGKGASFTPSPAVLEPPPSSTESVTTTFNKTMRLSPRQSSVPEKSPTTDRPPPTPQYPVRKATRRPVASDFVDLDGHARSITRASSHDGAQSTYNQQPPRSATSFISNVRPVRCVIDLSDSESEEEEAPVPPQKRNNGMKSSSATPSISTAMLEEKEREIQRMREEIAKREQESLLKKLGLKSGPVASNGHSPAPSTSVPTPGAAIPTPPPPTANESPTVSSTQPPPGTFTATPSVSQAETSSDMGQMMEVDPVKEEGKMNGISEAAAQGVNQQDIQEPVAMETDGDATSVQRHETEIDGTACNKEPDIATHGDSGSFRPYSSLFASYPTLRLGLGGNPGANSIAPFDGGDVSSSPSFEHSLLPDLQALRAAALIKQLDPERQICQFEVPGGGICRDAKCDDLHLSRLHNAEMVDPDDHDVAALLCSTGGLPPLDKVLSALQDARLKDTTSTLETRVARVMQSLRHPGPWAPPST